jgi:hypothetical protein
VCPMLPVGCCSCCCSWHSASLALWAPAPYNASSVNMLRSAPCLFRHHIQYQCDLSPTKWFTAPGCCQC